MRNPNYPHAVVLLSAFLFLTKIVAPQGVANARQTVSTISPVENWRPFILSNLGEIKVAAPPGADQTAKELMEIRKKMAQADEKIRQRVHYWDGGSPAYRWNEIITSLANFENPNAFFRFRTALG